MPSGEKGLETRASDWRWSSFRHYAFREMGIVEVESEWTAVDRVTQSASKRDAPLPRRDKPYFDENISRIAFLAVAPP